MNVNRSIFNLQFKQSIKFTVKMTACTFIEHKTSTTVLDFKGGPSDLGMKILQKY